MPPENANTQPQGLILEIQRMSTEDGPGIRTTVFFKGCPLNCAWCHNPESIAVQPQVHWVETRCIGCRSCIPACPEQALGEGPEGIRIDRDRCLGCGSCAEACPATAMEVLGRRWNISDLTHEVLKDRAFFDTSGGGITLSGGEPTLQSDFVADFLRQLKEAGVHTALDTCGLCRQSFLDTLVPLCDLVLFDLKVMNPSRHKELTGSPNTLILNNLKHVTEMQHRLGRQGGVWVRTPIIPGATADAENIRAIGEFLATLRKGRVARWELCAFNNLCRSKYERLDRSWGYRDTPLMTADEMAALVDVACRSGVDPQIVHWSGATRMTESGRAAATL